jgi:hypothetical protein
VPAPERVRACRGAPSSKHIGGLSLPRICSQWRF